MSAGNITLLLNRMSEEEGDGRKRLYDELVTLAYQDLRQCAQLQLRRERADSLQPSVLVHEVYERLLQYQMPFENRRHFLNVAAAAMRRVLIERARKLNAEKRGSGQCHEALDDTIPAALPESPEFLIDLDRALHTLRPEQLQLAELRFFAGFTVEETAEIMGLKPETVKKRWEVVKTLLFDRLESGCAR